MPHVFIASAQKQPIEMAQGDGMIAHETNAYALVPPKHQMENDGETQVSKVEGQEPSENENPAKEGEAMPMEDIEMTDAENAKGTAVKEDKVMSTEELEVSKAENVSEVGHSPSVQ
ncbi:hypothetical protein V6N11_002228 [Hibiscus sabdariffa]|uniref:Uncharacterized protein n=2 Tax=Hibiscus sabdariffa TaxID=183260 RepID=A0ABR2AMQ3_9ROSI